MNLDTLNRRQFLSTLGTVGALSAVGVRAEDAASEQTLKSMLAAPLIEEEQFGDPLLPGEKFEILRVSGASIQKAVGDDPVLPRKDAVALADRMREITRIFIKEKVSRKNKATQVLEFLDIVDEKGIGTPFCAAGVSYAACRAYCDLKESVKYDPDHITEERKSTFKTKLTTINAHYFFPNSAVRIIKRHAIEHNRWADRSTTPLPGWLVVYSWKTGETLGNHIGIVDEVKNGGKSLITLEYNTTMQVGSGSERDGGHVAEKYREVNDTVLGYVKIYNKR